ncbi:MAG: hypothetical protein EBU84_12610 [Actinobacteria bacterium]|nr:hypothetical protein [Actinomycetota bacterium]
MIKECEGCKKPFVADESWKRKCIVCWKRDSNYGLTKSDSAYELMQVEYQALERKWASECANLREVKEELVDTQDALDRAKAAYTKVRKQLSESRAPVDNRPRMEEEQLLKLIRLTHPDRHNNSELSNEITKWLLDLRKQMAENKGG